MTNSKLANSEGKTILVTGGLGFIGSHTVVELDKAGFQVVILDNLSNSNKVCLERVEKLVGKSLKFYPLDIRSYSDLERVFSENEIYAVIHFAALKAVNESISIPIEYYENNVSGTINLLKCMKKHQIKRIVFSGSASVYQEDNEFPVREDSRIGKGTNTYATSKYFCETMLNDVYRSDKEWSIVILRYFNPVGAHESGTIGEDPTGVPKNIMPYITQVVVGRLPQFQVFGNDYNTRDGTGVRDYVHVVDLSEAHVHAITKLTSKTLEVYNIGTGKGTSVLEMLDTMEKVSGKPIPRKIIERRAGDIAELYCDSSLMLKDFNWVPKKSLEDMCRDALRWQEQNPKGYTSS